MPDSKNTPAPTLLRALADATGLARRKAFAAIREGRVAVDGAAVADPSAPYLGGALSLDGRTLKAAEAGSVYLLMHKPQGVLSATSDPHGRRTVIDIVPVELRLPGLHPVGRLDQDTTGLLLLTNDGDFTFRLTHPRNEVEKEYWLRSQPPLTERTLETLREGVEFDGGTVAPLDAWLLPSRSGYETAVVLREGRKRQVRRMVEALGAHVSRLHRVREGHQLLGELAEGSVRRLSAIEVRRLLRGGPKGPLSARASSRSGRSAPRPGPPRRAQPAGRGPSRGRRP